MLSYYYNVFKHLFISPSISIHLPPFSFSFDFMFIPILFFIHFFIFLCHTLFLPTAFSLPSHSLDFSQYHPDLLVILASSANENLSAESQRQKKNAIQPRLPARGSNLCTDWHIFPPRQFKLDQSAATMRACVYMYSSSIARRQKGLTASHLHTQLHPFASQLTSYFVM